MHSPKFPLKAKDLSAVINVARLKTIWKSKVRDAMRTQPVPDVLEHLDFHIRLDSACTSLVAEVLSGSYIPRPPIRFLSEKSRGLCRQLVIPSVKDALVLQTLSDALWVEIRTKAPSNNAFYAPGDHKFSKSIKGHTPDYGPLAAWLAFQEHIFGFAQAKKYIVVTDIANYYDFISYDHLRNVLADLSIAREHALDLLLYALTSMLWQPDYMPRVPIGLPQCNLDAPRLLAHCFLFEIDRLLISRPSIEYARYMDDMDIGVDTMREAKEVLRDLDLSLQTRQIRLNSGKTKILSVTEARSHFKIRENAILDSLADRIKVNSVPEKSVAKDIRFIQNAIKYGFRHNVFTTGNGEKVLKRLITLARFVGADFSDEQFNRLLTVFPALRDPILAWWHSGPDPEKKLPIIAHFVRHGAVIDDATVMTIAISLVAARLPKSADTDAALSEIISNLDASRPWGFSARMWILSKYRSSAELMALFESRVSLWVTEEHLSRLAAGISPRMAGTALREKFLSILRVAGNPASQAVIQFHIELLSGTIGYSSIRKFITSRNTSLPNPISHAKFLMLLSILRNKDISPSATAQLKAIHVKALTDPYYIGLIP